MLPTTLSPRALALLFVISLAIKLTGVWYMNQHLAWNLMAPDTRGSYRPIAMNLVSGAGYQINGQRRDATRIAPLFPIYLAGAYRLFGADASTMLFGFLNAIMRAIVTLIVAVMAARGFGRAAGVWAGLLHGVDPWEAFWGAFVLKESLAVLLLAGGVWFVWRAYDTGRAPHAFAAAGLLAAAGLTRYPNLGLVPWFALLLLWAWWCGRRDLATLARQCAGLLLGGAIALSPWLVRNYQVYGEILISEPWAGRYFYTSNGPGTEDAPFETWGYSGLTVADLNRVSGEVRAQHTAQERDTVYLRAAVEHVLTEPLQFGRLVSARFANMWRPTFAGSSWANVAVLGVPYCGVVILALFGMMSVALARRRGEASAFDGRRPVSEVLAWVVAFFFVLHVFFWSEIRHRQYVMPFLTVFAGYQLARLAGLRNGATAATGANSGGRASPTPTSQRRSKAATPPGSLVRP